MHHRLISTGCHGALHFGGGWRCLEPLKLASGKRGRLHHAEQARSGDLVQGQAPCQPPARASILAQSAW